MTKSDRKALAGVSAQRFAEMNADRYNIVRMYKQGGKRTILRNVSFAEARAHCNNPETSSSTCTSAEGRARTRRMGEWFDGFDRV